MRALGLAAALALSACATMAPPKMSMDEAGLAPARPTDTRSWLAMNGRGLPAQMPRYVLQSSIVSFGGAASSGTCPFVVNTTSNSYTVDCAGNVTASNINGVNISGSNFNFTNTMSLSGTAVLFNSGGLDVRGLSADGASAIGVQIDNINTLSTAGAKLLSIRNNTVEKAFFDKDGNLRLLSGGSVCQTGSGNCISFGPGSVSVGGVLQPTGGLQIDTINNLTGNTVIALVGGQNDGASAVGVKLSTSATYANAGAKLASVQNNGTERFYVDVNGMPFAGTTLKPVPADITNAAATAIQHGTGTCAANTVGVTFGTAYSSGTPACTCSATTATASACNVNAPSNTGFTAKCAGATDTFSYVCFGLR